MYFKFNITCFLLLLNKTNIHTYTYVCKYISKQYHVNDDVDVYDEYIFLFGFFFCLTSLL